MISSNSKLNWVSAPIVLANDTGAFIEEQLDDDLASFECCGLESVAILSAISVDFGFVVEEELYGCLMAFIWLSTSSSRSSTRSFLFTKVFGIGARSKVSASYGAFNVWEMLLATIQ